MSLSVQPDLAVPSLPRGLKPLSPPKTLGGLRITGIRDLTLGYDSTLPPKFEPRLPNSGGEMITWTAGETGGEQVVLTIRTSGTEPKASEKISCQPLRLLTYAPSDGRHHNCTSSPFRSSTTLRDPAPQPHASMRSSRVSSASLEVTGWKRTSTASDRRSSTGEEEILM